MLKLARPIVLGGGNRHDDRTVATQRADAIEHAVFGIRVFVAVEHNQRITPGRGGRLRRPDDARVEGIGEIGDSEGDELGAAAAEVAGNLRRRVASLLIALSTRPRSSGLT